MIGPTRSAGMMLAWRASWKHSLSAASTTSSQRIQCTSSRRSASSVLPEHEGPQSQHSSDETTTKSSLSLNEQLKGIYSKPRSNPTATTAPAAAARRPWASDRTEEVRQRLEELKQRQQQQQQKQQHQPSHPHPSTSFDSLGSPAAVLASTASPSSTSNSAGSSSVLFSYSSNQQKQQQQRQSNHRNHPQSLQSNQKNHSKHPHKGFYNNKYNYNTNTNHRQFPSTGAALTADTSMTNSNDTVRTIRELLSRQVNNNPPPNPTRKQQPQSHSQQQQGNEFGRAAKEFRHQNKPPASSSSTDSSYLETILGKRSTANNNRLSSSTPTATSSRSSADGAAHKPDEFLALMRKNLHKPTTLSSKTATFDRPRAFQQQQQQLPPNFSSALPPHAKSSSGTVPSSTLWPSSSSSSPSSSSSSMDNTSISEIIRAMQENNQKRSKQMQEQQQQQQQQRNTEQPAFRLTGEVMPKWRQSSSTTPLQRQEEYEQRQRQQQQERELMQQRQQQQWQQQQQQNQGPKHRAPHPSELPPHIVTIPLFQLTLAEASTVFRLPVTTLRDVLDQLGLEPPLVKRNVRDDKRNIVTTEVPVGAQGWILSPDTLEEMAVLLDVPYHRVVSTHKVPNERELLLQRRNAATAVRPEQKKKNAGVEETASGKAAAAATAAKAYESLPPRPPVVAVMGHVDHGKTTLMDALRRRAAGETSGGGRGKAKKSKKNQEETKKNKKNASNGDVAGTEAGGITQVVSAFQVPLDGDTEAVTFLDTPGHKAFRAMRQSGSDAADILVLVVAADDGVSPQTVEIIEFYKSIVRGAGGSGISMVVALNKIDKPGINADEAKLRVQSQLLEHGIQTEGMENSDDDAYGPPVQIFPISALKGIGLDDLIEGLVLQAEVMELRADKEARGEGVVMDARVEKGVGTVVDCVIRWGTIKKGDIVVSGTQMGKVRLVKDVANNQLKQGFPSQPVRIIGFDATPNAGDPIICMESAEAAEDLIARRKVLEDLNGSADTKDNTAVSPELQSAGAHMMRPDWKAALEKKYGIDSSGDAEAPVHIPVLVKADADATLAAIREALVQIGEESKHNVVVDPIKAGVGPLLPTEVQLAQEFGASIICFNVKSDQSVINMASENGVKLLHSDIIYRLLDEAKEVFSAWLLPYPVEIVHGRAKVKASFDIGGLEDKVAGLVVIDGKIFKSKTKGKDGSLACKFRVLRNGKKHSEDLVASTLKLFKDDAEEVSSGKECGLSLSKYSDYEVGDEIECFSIEMQRPSI